ncbi:dipeptidyl-peptidase 3 family protein [Culturomica massiliensis]|jgi:dipeptidyl-peptidase-3|uniref:dipeptidyl-peptidase 3 family protein n=1 Tax=Culturomica massiliensis TaxID=1841857 RepID=UPI000837EAD5|nr:MULTISPECIES: dihydrofolate reductase [Odoribacteraceae]RHV96126.1 dihydrofolate reductase [Odoribacter sp. OF09-27XD]
MNFDNYIAEEFDDIRILRYRVDVFETLPLQEKLFVYYLSRAALAGRDILWDQNNRYNLRIRKVLERIICKYEGDRSVAEFQAFLLYAKKVFFANGIHHHYSMDKFIPAFPESYFRLLLEQTGQGAVFEELRSVVFDPGYMAKRVASDGSRDLIVNSANNYYENVTQQEVEDFYNNRKEPETRHPLNSTLVKVEGEVKEQVWKADGKYGREIRRIMGYLEQALPYAANEEQKQVIGLLLEFYRTGDLKVFDKYSIAWVKEGKANVDFINGFIEVYGDPLAYKASWESVVEIVDAQACSRTRKLAENALWFEKHAPTDDRFKKTEISGITARVMQVAMLGGDCHPATPIGINLPNAEWIRETYGSKSVTLDNITYAYHRASIGSGVTDEFAFSEEEKKLAEKYGYEAGNIHTDLHECLGHGSGKMLTGVTTDALKNYYSTLEEARADLFALYYIMDPKLVELGIVSSPEVARCEYNSYIRNGLLTQLTRIKPGNSLEESHMRNRQLIAAWVYEQGKERNVIERVVQENKTYFVIRDYEALRILFGRLLAEVQRIKSEGDYTKARDLVENYGVRIDMELHREVLDRYEKLHIPPYAGFINPEYTLVEEGGKVTDVKIGYPGDFLEQMLAYGREITG